MPRADVGAMNPHLGEIARNLATGGQTVLVSDGAGWHMRRISVVPDDVSLLKLRPRPPGLDPSE